MLLSNSGKENRTVLSSLSHLFVFKKLSRFRAIHGTIFLIMDILLSYEFWYFSLRLCSQLFIKVLQKQTTLEKFLPRHRLARVFLLFCLPFFNIDIRGLYNEYILYFRFRQCALTSLVSCLLPWLTCGLQDHRQVSISLFIPFLHLWTFSGFIKD